MFACCQYNRSFCGKVNIIYNICFILKSIFVMFESIITKMLFIFNDEKVGALQGVICYNRKDMANNNSNWWI